MKIYLAGTTMLREREREFYCLQQKQDYKVIFTWRNAKQLWSY